MSTKKHQSKKPSFLLVSILLFLVVLGIFALLEIVFIDRIFPAIQVANITVAGLTKSQAQQKIETELSKRLSKKFQFTYSSPESPQNYQISLSQELNQFNIPTAVNEAFSYGHQIFFYQPVNIPLSPNDSFLNDQLATLSKNVDQPAIDAQVKMVGDQINVEPSQDGLVLDQDKFKQIILSYLNSGTFFDSNLPMKRIAPRLSYNSALDLKNRLDQIKLKNLKIIYIDDAASQNNQTFILDLPTALSLINSAGQQPNLVNGSINNNSFNLQSITLANNTLTDTNFSLDKAKTQEYLQTLASKIDRPVQEPLFEYNPTNPNRIKEFSPPTPGKKVNLEKSYILLNQAFANPNQSEVTLAVDTINPQNHLSNDMGVKELIGTGISYFAGSIENRIFNVEYGASKINGVLIAPNSEFSFDQTVGDITAATGFKQAYVIKSGRTVLDDGGGICQISTTLFRAVLNAGLPVTARTAHAYRVHYYEEGGFGPGLDATVFYPSVDFRFKNDTGKYILIQTITQGTMLTVNLYGTPDGRVATVTNPIILSQTPPPPDLRQDDPTLPKGTVKQVDFQAWGAVTKFKRTVVRNGQTLINETFISNFRPWQAIYLVGTKEG